MTSAILKCSSFYGAVTDEYTRLPQIMTHEDFLTIYETKEENLIVSSRVFSEGVMTWDEFCIITPEIEVRFYEWLESYPLLKALR